MRKFAKIAIIDNFLEDFFCFFSKNLSSRKSFFLLFLGKWSRKKNFTLFTLEKFTKKHFYYRFLRKILLRKNVFSFLKKLHKNFFFSLKNCQEKEFFIIVFAQKISHKNFFLSFSPKKWPKKIFCGFAREDRIFSREVEQKKAVCHLKVSRYDFLVKN